MTMGTFLKSGTSHDFLTRSTRALVKRVLEHPDQFDWTRQGLGMLRTYIEPELRLHVWHGAMRFKDVSTMHTHPWNFHSLVVNGTVENQRFLRADGGLGGVAYMQQTIRCGVGGGLVGDPEQLRLIPQAREVYRAGQTYTQRAHEIHFSAPHDGTVTLIQREFLDDTEHAYVFYDVGGEWVTAEPREATVDEVNHAVGAALARWS